MTGGSLRCGAAHHHSGQHSRPVWRKMSIVKFRLRNILGLVVAALALAAGDARACTIPVFRYALERWTASRYEVIVFHNGDLTPSERAAVADATKLPANAEYRPVNVKLPMEPADEALWKRQTSPELPWVA